MSGTKSDHGDAPNRGLTSVESTPGPSRRPYPAQVGHRQRGAPRSRTSRLRNSSGPWPQGCLVIPADLDWPRVRLWGRHLMCVRAYWSDCLRLAANAPDEGSGSTRRSQGRAVAAHMSWSRSRRVSSLGPEYGALAGRTGVDHRLASRRNLIRPSAPASHDGEEWWGPRRHSRWGSTPRSRHDPSPCHEPGRLRRRANWQPLQALWRRD